MRTLLLFLLMILPLQVMAAAGTLENQYLRLQVSSQNGSVIHLVDKRTGTDYIGNLKDARLFRLLIPRKGYLSRRINSWGQKAEQVEVSNGVLTIRFHHLQISRHRYYFQSGVMDVPEPRLNIDVTVTFRLHGRSILGRIEVDNHSLVEITDVTFPWLGGLIEKSAGKPAEVVLPSVGQKILLNTSGSLSGAHAKRYPALLASTWINYEFPGKSVGIEARSQADSQDAFLFLTRGTLASDSTYAYGAHSPYIAWNFYPHIPTDSQWTSPEVVIHVEDSDWHAIARDHREWYRSHFSPTYSTAFNRSIGFATYRLKKQNNDINWSYAQIPMLARQAEMAGIRDLVIEGWRKQEGNGNHCPFEEIADPRLGGAAKLKATIGELHKQGIKLIFAFHPNLIDTVSKQYQEGAAKRWTVKTRRQANQLPPSYTFYTFDYPYWQSASHYWAVMDPTTAGTDYLLKQAKRLRDDYGFRNLFLRGVGLESFLSYNHFDPVPPQKVYEVGYAKLLGGLKKLFPQGMLMMEGFNDLVNRYSSAGYGWNQSVDPQILAYSLPWVPFSNDVEALDYDKANESFARKVLINLIVNGGDGTVGRYREFARHLEELEILKKATAPYYADADFRDHDGVKVLQSNPKVVLSVFRNRASRQMGIVVANLGKDPQTASFELEGPAVTPQGRLYQLGAAQKTISLAPSVSIPLGPYGVALVAINPNR